MIVKRTDRNLYSGARRVPKMERVVGSVWKLRAVGARCQDLPCSTFHRPRPVNRHLPFDFHSKRTKTQADGQTFSWRRSGKRATPARFEKLAKDERLDFWTENTNAVVPYIQLCLYFGPDQLPTSRDVNYVVRFQPTYRQHSLIESVTCILRTSCSSMPSTSSDIIQSALASSCWSSCWVGASRVLGTSNEKFV